AVPVPRAQLAGHPLGGGARALGRLAPRAPAARQRAGRSGPGDVRGGNGRAPRHPRRRPGEARAARCARGLEGRPGPVKTPVGAAMAASYFRMARQLGETLAAMAAPTIPAWLRTSRTNPSASFAR